MKYKVVFHPEVYNDLHEIGEYISQESAVYAKKVIDEILTSLRRLETFPLSAPLASEKGLAREGFRSLKCGKYLCFYKIFDTVVYIYYIVHGARNYPTLFDRFEKD